MTVQGDLQKAIASCEATKGSYSMMAQSTEDEQVKQMFNQMSSDVDRHIQFLSDRLNFLNTNNPLNNQ